MEWWTWIISGLMLLGLELFAPMGFYLFIIGLSCLIVGVLAAIGLVTSVEPQFTIAAILGIALIFLVRRPLAQAMSAIGRQSGSDITAQLVNVGENIAPGAVGRGELGGTTWNVRNESSATLSSGRSYRVKRTEGLTLIVSDL